MEQGDLQSLFEKYVPYLIDVITEGIVAGKQGEKLKTIVPQTSLNMVSKDLCRQKRNSSLKMDLPPPVGFQGEQRCQMGKF